MLAIVAGSGQGLMEAVSLQLFAAADLIDLLVDES
jgi:hypothetical protein